MAIGGWQDFSASEPQIVNSIAVDYDGNAMSRLDGFGNTIYIGDDGGSPPNNIAPAIYTFVLLSTPSFSIPTFR